VSRTLAGVLAAAVAAVLVTGTAGVTRAAPAEQGPGQVVVPARARIVKNQYIVTLRDTSGLRALAAARPVAEQYGGTVRRTYTKALNGFVLSATEQQARRLAADPRVARVEADSLVPGAAVRPYPVWNVDRIDQRSSVLDDSYSFTDEAGAGVTTYIMDTGIRTTHTQFGGRATVGFDAIGDGWNGQDCGDLGHGTQVAAIAGGTTYGLAERTSLVAVRVLGCDNFGSVSQIIAGVDWVTQNARRPAVVNMSLGGVSKIQTLDDAVAASIAAGITYVIAAGNSEVDTCTTSPANVPAAISVAASNPSGERATGWGGTQPGSNYGLCVDLFAPGEQVKSAYNASDRATRVSRGTSLAAPHVAGAEALILSKYPDATPAEVSAMIVGSATIGAINPATLRGTPDRLLYITDVIDPPVRPATP